MYYNKVEICGINTSTLKTLTDEEKDELLKKTADGDMNARRDLIDGNRGTVRRLASLLGEIPGDGEGTLEILESGREVNNLEHLARYERLYRRAEAIAEEAY